MSRLQARIALITGAASGIGLATARRFAAEGAILILADRNGAALSRARESLPGEGHEAVIMDVTDEQAWAALAERIKTRFGTLDILVNNAGFGKFGSIADTRKSRSWICVFRRTRCWARAEKASPMRRHASALPVCPTACAGLALQRARRKSPPTMLAAATPSASHWSIMKVSASC